MNELPKSPCRCEERQERRGQLNATGAEGAQGMDYQFRVPYRLSAKRVAGIEWAITLLGTRHPALNTDH